MNPNSEHDARKIVETLSTDVLRRATYMEIISEGIIEANSCCRSCWAVNMNDDAIRLTIAHYYVCTINSKGIWLALDDAFMYHSQKYPSYLPSVNDLNRWGWEMDDPETQPKAYPRYKDRSRVRNFSANGYYSVGDNHKSTWPHIRRLFLNLIYKATYHGQPMDKRTPKRHCPGFLKYARNQFYIAPPDPSYMTQNC